MRRLDLTLDDPADNLALDEALLLSAEQGGDEVIRFWRFALPVVILGRGSKIDDEVDVAYCQEQAIRILRRCSGGASIVAGPDCWMYSVVLSLTARPALRNIDLAHEFVIGRLTRAVATQRPEIQPQGICDLTLHSKKFSGNSLRVARNHLLYHGTILVRANQDLMSHCLRSPPREPEYRKGRAHHDFITEITLNTEQLADALAAQYHAVRIMTDWPRDEMKQLSENKYSSSQWTWRH